METTPNQPQKVTYSVKEACHVSSLGRSTIFVLIEQQKLKATKVGKRRLIHADSLHALIRGDERGED